MSAREPGGDVIDAYLVSDHAEETAMQPMRWTDDDKLETDPGRLRPVPSAEDYATAAESEAWVSGSGRRAERQPIPDPQRLAAMRRVAGQVVDMQDDDALVEAQTEQEIAEARELARQRRTEQRQHAHEQARAVLDEERAAAEHTQTMQQRRRQADQRAAKARDRQERASDPSHRLVLLSQLATWLPLAALVPGLLSIVLGASNAATQLTRISPATEWVNWMIEPMFSLGVLVILVAQWLGAVPSALHALKEAGRAVGLRAKVAAAATNGFFVLEVLLFVVTVLLQVGIHYVGPGHTGGLAPLVWSFVPLGLLISMALVPAVANRLNAALAEAVRAVAAAGSDRVDEPEAETAAEGGPSQVTAGASTPTATIPDPDQRSFAEALQALRRAVQTDQVDPGTGRPIDPTSAVSIRRTLRVGRDRSRDLRDGWKSMQAA